MQQEVEVKILNINVAELVTTLLEKKAQKVGSYRLTVDWYRPIGEKLGEENWFLRIRKYSNGKSEITWKGKSEKSNSSRSHKELNFDVINPDTLGELFCEINLEKYAHQEKDRQSWILEDWKIDIDQYPNMPAYAEIEGTSNAHVEEAIELLNLTSFERSTEGERILIHEKYNLDWLDMRFN